jgi:excisionase family DNA binding protein
VSRKKISIPAVPVVQVAAPEPKTGPRLLRVQQAADYLSATPWFIRSLIWSRSIPFLQLGKRHLIDVRDLDDYVDSQKAGPA